MSEQPSQASPARKYLKGGLLLSGGSVISAACSLIRNIIIARMISVEDFGIAATFAMTMSLIEMASNLASIGCSCRSPDGDAPPMLATAHAFQVFRGVLCRHRHLPARRAGRRTFGHPRSRLGFSVDRVGAAREEFHAPRCRLPAT